MYRISQNTDQHYGAMLGDWYVAGLIVPGEFEVGEVERDCVMITAPSGESIAHHVHVGPTTCLYSTHRETVAFIRRHTTSWAWRELDHHGCHRLLVQLQSDGRGPVRPAPPRQPQSEATQ